MLEAFLLKVLISSPSDTAEEVDAVKASLHGWNGDRSEAARVVCCLDTGSPTPCHESVLAVARE